MPDNFDLFETDDAELEALLADLLEPLGDTPQWSDPDCWTLDLDEDE